MNDVSSHSHAIFSIYLEINEKISNVTKTRKSVLHLADLAGSEKLEDSGAVGERLKEGTVINKSLLNLKQVIRGLLNSEKHISYRDSKLTFALKDSLGRNSKVNFFNLIKRKEKKRK